MFSTVEVCKSFGSQSAIHNVTLDIPEKSITALIGPSGSGKSTLLRLLLGFFDPTSGTILYKNKLLNTYDPITFKKSIGLVVQSGGLFPHLSAEENVALLGRTQGWSADQRQKRIFSLAEQCRISKSKLSLLPGELSGGQRQRISLMRALFLNPEVLVLDEPFSALDPLIRRELQEDLKQLFGDLEKTVILVTHDLPEAAFFSKKIALLKAGTLVQFGSYSDLVERPNNAFVTEFLNAYRPLEAIP